MFQRDSSARNYPDRLAVCARSLGRIQGPLPLGVAPILPDGLAPAT